ncbi:right-handed parallel beta-helix repeat-containing protein [Algibacter sp.]|nr:right-handed parallel beta-helix repeat-containing protein [Algibacter sp.]
MKKRVLLQLIVFLFALNVCAKNYYVSKNGNDNNNGKQKTPFLTIQKAASIMKPGDVCYISGGFYSEAITPKYSGTANNTIVFKPLNENDEVIISGANVIEKNKWRKESDNIFKVKIEMKLNHENQIFLGQKSLVEARWPNIGDDFLEMKTSVMDKGTTPENIIDMELPDYDFTGGQVWVHAKKYWVDWTSPILGQDEKSIRIKNLSRFRNHFLEKSRHIAGEGADYYIFGIKDALDANNEWFYDKNTKELFVYREDGVLPNQNYYVKERMYAFNLSDKQFIQLKNLDIIGATVLVNKETESVLLDGLKILYPYYSLQNNELSGDQSDKGVVLDGKNCVVQNSEIGFSTGSCLSVFGERNLVFNNYIHDANVIGSVASCVYLGGTLNVISHNTLTRAGRTVLSYSNMYKALIQNNDMSHAGKLTSDLGLTYGSLIEGGNSEVRYNFLHHNDDEHTSMGLYYDHGTQNIISHHNIIWGIKDRGLIINHYAAYHLMYNNTFISKSDGFRSNWGNRYSPDLLECRFVNNVFQNSPNTTAQNYYWNSNISGYKDFDPNNLMKPVKEGLGKGVYLKNITAVPSGVMPGIGAVEYEGMEFKAGHDFKHPPKDVNFKRSKPLHRNLIENAAFEKEDFIGPWKIINGALPTKHKLQTQLQFDDAIGRMGERSVELRDQNSEVYQKIDELIENEEYTFTGHLRVEQNEVAALGVRFSNGLEFFGPDVVKGAPKWSRSTVSFIVPEGELAVEVFVRRKSLGNGKVYVDDLGLALR